VFGVPLTYGSARRRLARRISRDDLIAGDALLIEAAKFLPWMMQEVRDVDAGEPRFGRVYAEIQEAPFGKIGKVVAEVRGRVLGKHQQLPRRAYLWYLSCGKCSNDRGFPTLIVCPLK